MATLQGEGWCVKEKRDNPGRILAREEVGKRPRRNAGAERDGPTRERPIRGRKLCDSESVGSALLDQGVCQGGNGAFAEIARRGVSVDAGGKPRRRCREVDTSETREASGNESP